MKSRILVLIIAFVLVNCGKKGVTPPSSTVPEKSALLLPEKDAPCVVASVVSSTENSVYFSWSRSNNAENYELTIKNLITNELITKNVIPSATNVVLRSGTPYAWFVVAKSSKSNITAKSDTWKFYNPGQLITYAPYPADELNPSGSEGITSVNGKIDLSWKGADADNDIKSYDVYMGTSRESLNMLKSGVAEMFLKNVAVNNGATYYWKVITKDIQGNTSDSGIYDFKVN